MHRPLDQIPFAQDMRGNQIACSLDDLNQNHQYVDACKQAIVLKPLVAKTYRHIADAASAEVYARYRSEAEKYPHLTVGGRLGSYRYLDMDKSMGEAMRVAAEFLRRRREGRVR